MRLGDKQRDRLLFVTEGVGAFFVAVFLAAYLAGLPTTAVLHSEPTFRIVLSVSGAVLLVLIVTVSFLSAAFKNVNDLQLSR